MIRLLNLIPLHGQPRVRSAVETALLCGSSDAATILHLLQPETRAAHQAALLAGVGDGWERPLPQLEMYDQLLAAESQTEVRA
jgi:hypothetical protein